MIVDLKKFRLLLEEAQTLYPDDNKAVASCVLSIIDGLPELLDEVEKLRAATIPGFLSAENAAQVRIPRALDIARPWLDAERLEVVRDTRVPHTVVARMVAILTGDNESR